MAQPLQRGRLLLHKAPFAKDAPDLSGMHKLGCQDRCLDPVQGVRMAAPKPSLFARWRTAKSVSSCSSLAASGLSPSAIAISILDLGRKLGRCLIFAVRHGIFVDVLPPLMECKMLPSRCRISRDQAPKGSRAPESETGLQIGWALLRK